MLNFYDARRKGAAGVEPNAAHRALARLQREWSGGLLLVTQNVDNLHERAGAEDVLHMHGDLAHAWCTACDSRPAITTDLIGRPACPDCGKVGALRPDVVWFGEMPYQMDRIYAALDGADLFVSIGTSGAVYPAAGFVQEARGAGARCLELNLEPSQGTHMFHEARHGPAGQVVPAWVDEVLGR